MKIKIEKPNQHAPIHIELAAEPGKKPLVLDLQRDQALGLIDLVKLAVTSDKFAFTTEV